MTKSMRRWMIAGVWVLALGVPVPVEAQKVPPGERAGIIARALERLRSGWFDHPLVRRQQRASLGVVYRAGGDPPVMPDAEEIGRFHDVRSRFDVEALDYLDEFYGAHDELKALALRDSDGDGVPDFRVSDYYGKFMEGDVDLDGDGARNVLDSHPHDKARGGRDLDGDGIPDAEFVDVNSNGLPDHIDWALRRSDVAALADIQLGLFRDHKIVLVDRSASFDLPLAQAVDDTLRRVYKAYFDEHRVLPTLRTIATETTALLTEALAHAAEDDTSAQVFSQTQSLIIYNEGRAVADRLGLLGLLVHEIGHSYHMSLDFDRDDIVAENGRLDFPAPNFVDVVKPFGWITTGYYDGEIAPGLSPGPRFVYAGMSEPVFMFRDKTPEEWQLWIDGIYEDLGRNPKYLMADDFVRQNIVGDYSLSTPYEWYGDNFIAYVVTLLEEETLAHLGDDAEAKKAAMTAVDDALRTIWPGFYHRNLAQDVRQYFERTFPIAAADRRHLAERYLVPLIRRDSSDGSTDAARFDRVAGWMILVALAVLSGIALWRFRAAARL